MFEKRAHQFRIFADFGELCLHTLIQLLTLLQRAARVACPFGMAPHQFIRVQLRRIAWQEVQRQTPLRADRGLSGRMCVESVAE